MGVLSKLNTATFSVPLLVSTLLLRVLSAAESKRKRPTLLAGRRVPPPAAMPAAPADRETAAPKKPPAAAKNHPPADVKAMRRELTAVLDAHEGSREVFRYLAHFERQLAKHGLQALEVMTVKRLRRALAQFEAIVTNWSQPKLAELRSRMAVALSMRNSAGAMWVPAATLSKAYGPREMPMLARARGAAAAPDPAGPQADDDVSISRFEAALGDWHLSQRQALMAIAHEALAGR